MSIVNAVIICLISFIGGILIGIIICEANAEKTVHRIMKKLNNDDNVTQKKKAKWIDVSEMLPKTAGIYRVTRYYPNNAMNPNYLVDACFFDGSNTWHNDNRVNHERAYVDNVIAWQENPEPYKVESGGEK